MIKLLNEFIAKDKCRANKELKEYDFGLGFSFNIYYDEFTYDWYCHYLIEIFRNIEGKVRFLSEYYNLKDIPDRVYVGFYADGECLREMWEEFHEKGNNERMYSFTLAIIEALEEQEEIYKEYNLEEYENKYLSEVDE